MAIAFLPLPVPVASSAPSHGPSVLVRPCPGVGVREFVTPLAMRLIGRARLVCSGSVLTRGDRFKVRRSHASGVAAKMVENHALGHCSADETPDVFAYDCPLSVSANSRVSEAGCAVVFPAFTMAAYSVPEGCVHAESVPQWHWDEIVVTP